MIPRIFSELRLGNLAFLFLCQMFVYQRVYAEVWVLCTDTEPCYGILEAFLLSLVSVLVAMFGNLQNDYLDLDQDLKFGKKNLSARMGQNLSKIVMGLLVIAALSLCLFGPLASISAHIYIIPFLSILLLSWYNYKLKCVPLIGNITVAGLSATGAIFPVVILMAYCPVWKSIPQDMMARYDILHIALSFWLLAFLASLSREMIKDVEDRERDLDNSCSTVAGISNQRVLKALVCLPLVLLVSFLIHILYKMVMPVEVVTAIGILISISLALILYISFTNLEDSAKRISFGLKVLLFLGVSTLAWLPFEKLLYHAQ